MPGLFNRLVSILLTQWTPHCCNIATEKCVQAQYLFDWHKICLGLHQILCHNEENAALLKVSAKTSELCFLHILFLMLFRKSNSLFSFCNYEVHMKCYLFSFVWISVITFQHKCNSKDYYTLIRSCYYCLFLGSCFSVDAHLLPTENAG